MAKSKGLGLLYLAGLGGLGALYLASGKKAKGYEEISELASRKAAGETLSLAEETRLQDYIESAEFGPVTRDVEIER